MKLTFYFDVAVSSAMLPQEKRVKRKREDADANADADGRHAGVSDNNVVHGEAEAHVTHPTDATEQEAGSSEGVKKNKKRHSPSDLVNVDRKDDDRDAGAGDDNISGEVQSDSMLPPGNKKYRRHSVHATEDVDGPLSPKTPMQLRILPKHTTPIALNQRPLWTSEMRRARRTMMMRMNSSLYAHRRDHRRETGQKSARARIGNY